MAFHDDFLDCARTLIPPFPAAPNSPAPLQAHLRRGVSTAYYALFHLLIDETMTRMVADPSLRIELGRSMDHKPTKEICKKYASATLQNGSLTVEGSVIPTELCNIGSAFVSLIEARQDADYDTTKTFTHQIAFAHLTQAEDAFLDWATVKDDPATDTLLKRILLASVGKRR